MQNTYLPDAAYEDLIVELGAAFMIAAVTTGCDLRDKLVEALAMAGIMPECCREDAEAA
ncbi:MULTISPECIES: hypothetical protein [unclassified Paracoccus (in: a-proteobacteria)]|uniref:hypothetical protein n=1 Tax=unclassified Paracoccus (in: a-proteobacteria) TaxID=2688777 RepID=UPI0004B81D77|nr:MULTISPECIES: hypothetical protein [unclassified Paracoccus (in: a-proteobacteria)]